jgi:hypothetical protein
VPAAVRFISAEPLLGPVDALDLSGIDWLIAGGESGAQARPVDVRWVAPCETNVNAAGLRSSSSSDRRPLTASIACNRALFGCDADVSL